MPFLRITLISFGICAAAMLTAQKPSGLAVAKAMDQEILKLSDLPDDARELAIKDLALRIRQQPRSCTVALAFNLAISATGASGRDTLQKLTTTLVDALRKSTPQNRFDYAYLKPAELARYDHMRTFGELRARPAAGRSPI